MGAGASRLGRMVLAAALAASTAQVASAGPPLRRDLAAFHIFGLRNVDLKNYVLNGACNIGVDCAQPSSNSSCGVETQENVSYDQGSQIAADVQKFNKPGATVWQVFTNKLSGAANVSIGLPPVEPLTPLPILGDVNGNGNPSCAINGGQCITDPGDMAAACGFPSPFPTCNVANPVLVLPNSDCVIAPDAVPNNNICDLAPGNYGTINVQDNGKLNFTGTPAPGNYTFCSFNAGKGVQITADRPVVLNVSGDVAVNNNSSFGPAAGQNCGQITVNISGPGGFAFGRHGNFNGFFCAPERTLLLGHDNNLTGRFFGDTVLSDSNDRGFCCSSGGCACYEAFSPSTVVAGDTLTITGTCSLTAVTAIDFVCPGGTVSVSPPFISQTSDKIEVTVPALPGPAPRSCTVQVESTSGTFTGNGTLTVN
jgi:hypothetical protein